MEAMKSLQNVIHPNAKCIRPKSHSDQVGLTGGTGADVRNKYFGLYGKTYFLLSAFGSSSPGEL